MLTIAATRFKELDRRGIDGTPRHPESDERNMHLEVVLLHARGLDEFLRSGGTQPDDLQARDYVPGWQTLPVLSEDVRKRINKQLGHLTKARLNKGGFVIERDVPCVLRGVLAFIRQVPNERRAWFAEAEERATNTLPLFPRPRRGPFDGPVATTS